MATAVTNDSGNRARLTVDASGGQNTISWSASVTDNSASLGGFGDAGFWNVTIGPYVVANASGSYDFGANSPAQYFPRAQSGTLTGVPAGTYTVTGTFRGNVGSTIVGTATIAAFNVFVSDPPPPPPPPTPVWSTGTTLPTATRGSFYSATVSASPVTSYTPIGSSGQTGGLSASGNVISGVPNTVGSASFTIRADNSGSIADRTFSFTINPALPVFSDGSVNSSARVGIAYSDGVSASETSSYSVVAAPNSLPPGLSLNTSNGAITGTPTTPGSYSFRIRASNVTGSTDTAIQTITVISSARVWNGSAFVVAQARVWNGSSFVTGTIRVWDGSAWVNTK
jgi:hypothetical protein